METCTEKSKKEIKRKGFHLYIISKRIKTRDEFNKKTCKTCTLRNTKHH